MTRSKQMLIEMDVAFWKQEFLLGIWEFYVVIHSKNKSPNPNLQKGQLHKWRKPETELMSFFSLMSCDLFLV